MTYTDIVMGRRSFARTGDIRTTFRKMMQIHRSRGVLGDLEDRLLDDIGVSREQALEESRRAPWDAPGYFFEK